MKNVWNLVSENPLLEINLPVNCKILLLLDSCTARTASGVVEKNIVVLHYFPPNCNPADGSKHSKMLEMPIHGRVYDSEAKCI